MVALNMLDQKVFFFFQIKIFFHPAPFFQMFFFNVVYHLLHDFMDGFPAGHKIAMETQIFASKRTHKKSVIDYT